MDKKILERVQAIKESLGDPSLEDALALAAKEQMEKEEYGRDLENLNKKLAAYETGKIKAPKHPLVKIGKESYFVTGPIGVRGRNYTPAVIAANKEHIDGMPIANWLHKKKSSVLKPKTK